MWWQGATSNGSQFYTSVTFPTQMRASPTATYTNDANNSFSGTPIPLATSATILMAGQTATATSANSFYGMNFTADAEL